MSETAIVSERVGCAHCGEDVPPGAFCGHCGANLSAPEHRYRRRTWSFAAAPHEHVLQLAIVSTLFPHLPHRHAHAFRRGLIAGIAVFLLLTALHLYAAATLAASLVLPILYLLYLYDVEVYEHEPVLVLAVTFGIGVVAGTVVTFVLGPAVAGLSFGPATLITVLISGVLIPLISQLLMVAGPLLLLGRRHFDEGLDGLAFGVTSALGFSLAVMVATFGPIIVAEPLQTDPLDWAARLIRQGLFVFIVNAGATGAITTSIWLGRHGRNRHRNPHWHRGLIGVAAVAVLIQLGLGVASTLITDLMQLLVLWGVGAAVLLVFLRVVIHHVLLEEGGLLSIGEPSLCRECHHIVPTMLFCPSCGIARSAAPKHRPVAAATRDAVGDGVMEAPA